MACLRELNTEKLTWMCGKVGIDTNQDVNAMAVALADLLESEMSKDSEKPSVMVEAFAPLKRKEVWRPASSFPPWPAHPPFR